mgnify:CR=1 FL=1
MDGYECTKLLKQLFAEHVEFRCPVIACTAYVNPSEKELAKQAGMDDYCTKPVSKQRIVELVRKYL